MPLVSQTPPVLVAVDAVVEHLVTYVASYEARTGQAAADAARRDVRAGLERWLRAGLVEASPEGLLDPVACVNAMKRAALGDGGDPIGEAYFATGRRLVLDSEASGASASSSWRMTWQRAIPRRAMALGTSGLARIRVPLPLDRAHESVAIVSVEASSEVVRTRQAGGSLDVFLAPGDDEPAEVTVTTTFRQGPRCVDAAPPSFYLCERDGLATTTESTRRLADRVGSDPVDGVWRFLFEHLASGSLHHHLLDRGDPLASVIEGGVFDCYAGAALLVTACRARGIPARIVGGVALHPIAPFQHYWAEVHLEGEWRPFDAMSWDLARGRLDDETWSRRTYGRTGPRVVTEHMPDAVIGPVGFRPPSSWFLLVRLTDSGTEQSLHDGAGGALLCRDRIDVAGPGV
jgi:hypothetical protein